ncbi:hypothetical protein DPEC_G00283840 [Dallia pectoralis]|uniref:Uncharacterized protein n=1 Tax=Dallia pectoralis TaxID=75939 RepID=A0ACC2FJA3_DALPE|nr:hypothetical protein DPEC_G00283840 [Dallia pectoralis]
MECWKYGEREGERERGGNKDKEAENVKSREAKLVEGVIVQIGWFPHEDVRREIHDSIKHRRRIATLGGTGYLSVDSLPLLRF